jgi:hypothetical protein
MQVSPEFVKRESAILTECIFVESACAVQARRPHPMVRGNRADRASDLYNFGKFSPSSRKRTHAGRQSQKVHRFGAATQHQRTLFRLKIQQFYCVVYMHLEK